MALPTYGQLSMYQICDEFNVPRNTPLMDFYRGGGIVPNTTANSSVPTYGPISILDFYGARSSILELSGGPNATFTPPSGSVVTRVGIMVRPNGEYFYTYTYFIPGPGEINYIDVVGNIGGWLVGYPLSGTPGTNYEVGFGLVPDSYQTLSQERITWVGNTSPPTNIAVRIRERANTSNWISWLSTVQPA